MRKAIIIGSGIAGIATSIRLANKGYEVHVYEANSYPGGKLTSFKNGGFRFDAGPSLFTMPHLVTELFEICGEDPKDHFVYNRMDSICNYFWEDGTRFQMPAAKEDQINQIASVFKVSRSEVAKYLKNSEAKYALTAPIFLEKSLHKASTYLSFRTIKALFNSHRFNLFSTLDEVNTSYFDHPKLIQLLNRFATYNGSSPYKTPGIMSMIPHLEMNIGTFFPEGGMASITNSLVGLAERIGVRFHYNCYVDEIIHDGKKVQGVLINNKKENADVVVSNMDVFSTYSKTLHNVKAPTKTLAQERSSSALIFYWGIKKDFPELDLHNILFSNDYQSEFKHIFETESIFEDPTIYINISSKKCEDDAPVGSENWFVMINTPGDTGQDWAELIRIARSHIIAKINRMLKTNIEPLIVCEEILSPPKIASKTMSHSGSLYGSSSNNRYAAFLRHANFSSHLNNLFFCGGSVHPGGGIPLCLNSAKIVSNFID